jgi:repressor LexA
MITKRQKEVLDFIKFYQEKNEYSPSLEEIKKKLKIASVSTAHYHVRKLQREGYLEKKTGKPRSINFSTVSNKEVNAIGIPILGSANAGPAKIFAEENIEGYLKVSKNKVKRKEDVFALRVEGNSLNRAKINGKNIGEGDFVLIDSKNRIPVNGDYVLSIIDDCANLKKFKQISKTGQIMLISESTNPKHKPIYISSEDDLMINGKIIDVIKK